MIALVHPICSGHPDLPDGERLLGAFNVPGPVGTGDTARIKTDQKACPGRTEEKQKAFSLVCMIPRPRFTGVTSAEHGLVQQGT